MILKAYIYLKIKLYKFLPITILFLLGVEFEPKEYVALGIAIKKWLLNEWDAKEEAIAKQ